MLWVSEYGRIRKADESKNYLNGELELAKSDFDPLLTLLEDTDENNLSSVFRYHKHAGVDCLQVQNYVGVIRTENECQFEILPKISSTSDQQTARELLVKMLIELKGSPFKRGTVAELQAHKMSFLETFLKYFLDQVANVVRQGIARSYVNERDDLVYLRGKLQLTEHLKRNMFRTTQFHCEFDEYEANRPINRLIKRALEVVLRKSRDPGNLQHCRELLFWFDRVPPSMDIDRDFRSLRQDRLVRHYAPAMPSCKLILEGLNPLSQSGKHRTIGLLFDMNTVFQDYVVAKLSEQFRNFHINAQTKGSYLVESFNQRAQFGLIPDVELTRKSNGYRIIADCKWKLLDTNHPNHGVSQSDMYQIFAYCKKCLVSQEDRCTFLIYPKTDRFHSPRGPYYFDNRKREMLYVLPFDLEKDVLITDSIDMFEPNLHGRAA